MGQGGRETGQDSRETTQNARETSQEPQRVHGLKITLPTLKILFSGVHSTRWVSTQLQCSVGRGFEESLSEDEDAEGDSKKISAAQYEIFRQAVTISKGTYKVNPAKTKRAARASLLDLGDTEVPDRVSWLDQLSLQDTMASMARIA